MKRALIGACLVIVVGLTMWGCGSSSNPNLTVIQPTPVPANLTIRGTVYANNQGMATIPIVGIPISPEYKGQPLAGATVYLSGSGATRTAVSDANGEYKITGVPQTAQQSSSLLGGSGGYTIIASKEGYQRRMVDNIQLSGSTPLPDNSEVTIDIGLSPKPVIMSLTPSVGTTIEAGPATFTVTFNEPMDPSSVRPSLTCQGLRSAAAGDTQSLSTAWSDGNRTLTISAPNLLPNQTYRLEVDPRATAKDADGNQLDWLILSMDDFSNIIDLDKGSGGVTCWVFNAGIDLVLGAPIPSPPAGVPIPITDPSKFYRTVAGGVPGAPGDVQVSLGNPPKQPANASYSDVFPNVGSPPPFQVDVYWAPPTSGQISGYRVYVSLSSTGPWTQLLTTGGSTIPLPMTTPYFIGTVGDVSLALFGTTNLDPVSIGKWPFVNNKVYFKVVAFNGDGESPAAAADAQIGKGPSLHSVADDNTGGGYWSPYNDKILLNGYQLLKPLNNQTFYVSFDEPVDIAYAQIAGSYIITGPGTVHVVTATVMTTSSSVLSGADGCTIVKIVTDNPVIGLGYSVNSSGVKDLAGNLGASLAVPIAIP